jgi:hypothetical protein
MKPFLFAAAGSLACMAAPALASTQGTPGQTSTGTVTINASITPEVNISNLDDFTFTATELQTALNTGRGAPKIDAICVWSNNVDGSYFITATGDGAGNAFTITNGTDTADYALSWIADGQTGRVLVSGTKSQRFTSAATVPDCGGGTTARLLLTIPQLTVQALRSGTTYTGVLTLLVSPT